MHPPCGQSHFMLSGPLYPGLRVKCQSGAHSGKTGTSGVEGPTTKAGLTLPFEMKCGPGGSKKKRRERERRGVRV